MLTVKVFKQFCKHGHDTQIVGRSKLGMCKECDRIRHRKNYYKHWAIKSAQGINRKLLTRYFLTEVDYLEMFKNQNGRCKICKRSQTELKRSLAVDHCHKSGKIRGLLCMKCNTILGLAADNVEILTEAIKYLNY